MAFWNRKKEKRALVEDPNVPLSAANVVSALGWDSFLTAAGVSVTIDSALTVPAVWAAVNFISGTIASLPIHHYKKTDDGREKMASPLSKLLSRAINDETTSFDWRKYCFDRVFTGGRCYTYIERNATGKILALWPLNPANVTVKRVNGKKVYQYAVGDVRKAYQSRDIIDVAFMCGSDMISHKSPIMTHASIIGLAIAVTEYGNKFFNNGGVPPFLMTGNFTTPEAIKRAASDLNSAVKDSTKDHRLAVVLPQGHEITSIGIDPENMQMMDVQRYCVEQIARIYSLPPTFLQDLTHGTFSNTEQQDLHFVKHTLRRWVYQFEQELNLKLFGADTSQYIEFSLEGLLRGDFSTRMDGYATAIQNAILTPNEVRESENRIRDEKGDHLLIQGATVPLGTSPFRGNV